MAEAVPFQRWGASVLRGCGLATATDAGPHVLRSLSAARLPLATCDARASAGLDSASRPGMLPASKTLVRGDRRSPLTSSGSPRALRVVVTSPAPG